jgi:hypothetical protein
VGRQIVLNGPIVISGVFGFYLSLMCCTALLGVVALLVIVAYALIRRDMVDALGFLAATAILIAFFFIGRWFLRGLFQRRRMRTALLAVLTLLFWLIFDVGLFFGTRANASGLQFLPYATLMQLIPLLLLISLFDRAFWGARK